MALDLKNPGGKEILIFGGGAAGLALIYFALNKNKGTAATPAQQTPQSTPGTGGGLGSTGTAPTTGGVGTIGTTPGNVFQDIATSVPTSTGQPVPRTPSPPARVQGVRVSQGAQEILGSGSPSPGSSPSPGGGAVPSYSGPSPTAANIYNALVKGGLLPYQAAGVLGNIQNESLGSGGPEAIGDNGTSYGLVQWHSLKYNPSQYVTGNVAADFNKQIKAIVQEFKTLGIGGTTAAQVAGNWASQFEGCMGCQPGGAQWSQRMANANAIWQNVLAGKFNVPKPKPVVSTGGYNNFPGGLSAWRKLFQQGTTPATSKQIQGLFPTVKPQPKPVRLGAGLSSRASKKQLSNLGKGLSGGLARLTAAIYPKPAPRKPAYRPTPKRGPGHPLLR